MPDTYKTVAKRYEDLSDGYAQIAKDYERLAEGYSKTAQSFKLLEKAQWVFLFLWVIYGFLWVLLIIP